MKAHTSQNFKRFHNCHALDRQQRYTHDITFYYRFAKLASLLKCTAKKTTSELPFRCTSKVALVICMYVCVFVCRKDTRQKAGIAALLKYRNKKLPGYSLTYVQHASSCTQFQTSNVTCGAKSVFPPECTKSSNATPFHLNDKLRPLERQRWPIVVSG